MVIFVSFIIIKKRALQFFKLDKDFPGTTFGKAVSWDIIQVALTSIMPSVFSNLYIAKDDMGPRSLFMDLVYLPPPWFLFLIHLFSSPLFPTVSLLFLSLLLLLFSLNYHVIFCKSS